ncbi:MAG: beta-N-acetylhexosaminidase [Candidatus Gastranaerophilales bacterium]|nr:beta-N-acetylhexosaminidase [Candidatus Gastranaerophilales bacterium]
MEKMTLKEKISQMFICGFVGDNPDKCKDFQQILKNNLGGVIFFSQNITSTEQFKKIIYTIKNNTRFEPFLSIDQEGGRVERTESIHNGKKYLSARAAAKKGIPFLKEQTKEMAKELKSFGINMNFAPVLDVNTNINNPVIGDRAYSDKVKEVVQYSLEVNKTYLENGIITVGKHFPGHGDASIDSHKALPQISLSMAELESDHIYPFKKATENKIPAIMVAHVHYPAFDKENIPASMSENIIKNYLINKMNYNGLIISDDMVMGAIQGFTPLQACKKAINAGINMFIFRNTDKKVLNLIDCIEQAVLKGEIDITLIDKSVDKILSTKSKYLTDYRHGV